MTAAMTTLTVHPAALIFPEMTPDEYAGLRDDIAAHGQRDPIITWQGQILDGRHRFRACEDLDLDPVTLEYEGEISEIPAFVISRNLHRRHLTASQRAMVAV